MKASSHTSKQLCYIVYVYNWTCWT